MIKISEFKAFFDTLKQSVPGFDHLHLAVFESHLIKKLEDLEGVHLGIVYPSAQRKGKPNFVKEEHATWLFILEKENDGQTNEQEQAQYEKLQSLTEAVIKYIDDFQSAGCSIFPNYDPSGTEINPLYRTFGGFNGWAFSLVF